VNHLSELVSNTVDESCAGVVIGRNEGSRLVKCLQSLLNSLSTVVYVDSGSTDGSVDKAKSLGVAVIQLDLTIPFTAARARNEGANYLIQKYPELNYIQFVDGDCEMQLLWIDTAVQFLDEHADYAVACGRRRERFPERSIYNQLCDIEWNTPIGDAFSCGGDALIGVEAFKQVDGYRDDLIAGEEPEMCFRLRNNGWKVRRIDADMVLHDANMTKISQWWNRSRRSGYAYAHGCYLHGRSVEKYNVKQVASVLFWALVVPVLIVIVSTYDIKFLSLVAIYPLQIVRLTIKGKQGIKSMRENFFYALSNVVGKFPQVVGILKFVLNKVLDKRATLIEYK